MGVLISFGVPSRIDQLSGKFHPLLVGEPEREVGVRK
jgi:hypothetical protein